MSTAITLTLLAAVAALDEPSDPQPDEIVVTGERIPRTLRETAASVDITTADRIDALSGADRIEQVLEQVPNVVLGGGGEGPAIRGQDTTGVLRDLPAFLGGTRPRTTLQVDGRAVSFNELVFGAAGLWDLERIEVFRTPQTTTQGHNSIAGAIFIHSRDPTYDWEARGRLLGGNYRARQASAMISGPIVDGQLAFRAAGDLRRGRPSVKSVDTIRGADPNNDDYGLLRFKLLGEPGFWPGLRAELTYTHSESLMPGGENMRPPFRERRNSDGIPTFKTNVDSLTAQLEQGLTAELRMATTLSLGDTRVQRFSVPGLGETKTHIRDHSVEAVLDWNPAGPTRLIGGVAHRRSTLDQLIDITLAIGIGEFDDRQTSVGAFGEVSFSPLARTEVTAGLRYQRDRQQRFGAVSTSSGEIPLRFDGVFSAWLPKLSIAYDATDDIRVGALIQRAYNPGGTTLRVDIGELDNFDAETLWNYELFARARFADGALTLSGNLFHTAMRDALRHRIFFVGPLGLAEIFNVPRARTHGAEFTIDWKASERFSARAAFGLLNTKITGTDADSQFLHGNEFARSPGFTASGSVDWRPIEPLRLSTQIRHLGSYYSNDLENEERRIGPATLVDARASWTAGRATLFGYVRNLFDSFRLRFLYDGRNPGSAAALAATHDPREVGIGVEARF